MSLAPAPAPVPVVAEPEALEVLTAELDGHTATVPARLVASHLLRVTEGGDFALRRAALDAFVRRIKAVKDDWRLVGRRRGARVGVGVHQVGVARGKHYHVVVSSFAQLRGSCDCADFARSSLGLCKHLWWVLVQGFDKHGRPNTDALAPSTVSWEPARPLIGPGDWLERIRWTGDDRPASLRRDFDSRGQVQPATAHSPKERHRFIRALLPLLQRDPLADPALVGLLRREQASLARQVDAAPTQKETKRALGKLKRPLFPYQEAGVARFLEAGRLLLADDMGLGKTAQAIASCHVLHVTGRVNKGLVIVPAALKPQWLREWKLFSEVPATIVDGPPEARLRQYRALQSGFLIVNYEQVLKDLSHLEQLAPDLVVLDEAQRIKNWAAKTSLAIKQLHPAWRLVLTGTPLENRLTELASLMDWVDDLALEPKWRLTEWHTVRADGARDAVGAKNLDTLRIRLAPFMLRRVRQEVLKQLPPRTDTRVPVTMTAEQLEAHTDLDRPIAQLMRASKVRPLSQPEFLKLMSLMTRQRIICNGLAQRDFEAIWPSLVQQPRPTEAALRGLFSPKLTEFRELISNLVVTQGRKVVVFSQWKRMLHLAEWAVADVLADAGARAVHFTGDESQKRRTQNIVDFHDDPRARVFFATDAGGVGLNLQRAASACVHLDLPWNPAVMEQRAGRVYRLGQTRPVEIYALVSVGGIEARIASIVGGKKALFDGVFDGVSDEVRFEGGGGSFISRLQETLEPGVEAEGVEEDEDSDVAGDVSDQVEAPSEGRVDFMAGVSLQRMADGRLVLEAKPEVAAALASVFEGLAAMFKQQAAR
jgi:superfamily II DNA or RNA helicase